MHVRINCCFYFFMWYRTSSVSDFSCSMQQFKVFDKVININILRIYIKLKWV